MYSPCRYQVDMASVCPSSLSHWDAEGQDARPVCGQRQQFIPWSLRSGGESSTAASQHSTQQERWDACCLVPWLTRLRSAKSESDVTKMVFWMAQEVLSSWTSIWCMRELCMARQSVHWTTRHGNILSDKCYSSDFWVERLGVLYLNPSRNLPQGKGPPRINVRCPNFWTLTFGHFNRGAICNILYMIQTLFFAQTKGAGVSILTGPFSEVECSYLWERCC